MHRLVINQLGPIEYCELECSKFMTFTGFQASGKSTIAKAIYYFHTVKDDILLLAKKRAFNTSQANSFAKKQRTSQGIDLTDEVKNYLGEKFLRTFGVSSNTCAKTGMEYAYTEKCSIKVLLHNNVREENQNYIEVIFSNELEKFLTDHNSCFAATSLGIPENEENLFREEMENLFDDVYSVVFIPAGRSILTLLSQQLSYIYATMDDSQKRSLDICTKDFIERILVLKPLFSDKMQRLKSYSNLLHQSQANVWKKYSIAGKDARILMKKILRGDYSYEDGEEHIVLENGERVKLSFASSGQQESVWILNLLYYYLLGNKKVLFIIEEPESNLFPESQKYITELIALVSNCGHSVVMTTHSPYVLGTLNNLLYANTLKEGYAEQTDKIISQNLWLDEKDFDSWFVKEGKIENCMDSEIHMIQNERIDGISSVINDDFEKLLEIQNMDEEGA
ncbi:MAG: ATP-binding protein [Lachnospiraceae bacterium]|nr:ATP-binding protein [Lachnospiraceae bacterium]